MNQQIGWWVGLIYNKNFKRCKESKHIIIQSVSVSCCNALFLNLKPLNPYICLNICVLKKNNLKQWYKSYRNISPKFTITTYYYSGIYYHLDWQVISDIGIKFSKLSLSNKRTLSFEKWKQAKQDKYFTWVISPKIHQNIWQKCWSPKLSNCSVPTNNL